MTNQKLPSNLDVDEVAFEKMFEAIEHNPEICKLEEIDPSKPGWEVVLYFDDLDPQAFETEVGRDYWKLEQWSALGHFALSFSRKPNPVVVLSHDENCEYQSLNAEELSIMKKYRPLVKAPQAIRRKVVVTPPPLPPVVAPALLIDQTVAHIDEVIEVADDEYETVEPEDLVKIANLSFAVLAVNVSKSLPGWEDALNDLEWVAAEEDLNIQVELHLNPVEIYFTRKEGVEYERPMHSSNLKIIERYPFSLIE